MLILPLALGCDVLAFEPVGAYAEVLSAAALLNEGFASRLTLLRNVVYSQRGTYQLRVPIAFDRRKTSYRKKLGMTGMIGAKGLVKGYPAHWRNFNASARSVRIDELVDRAVGRRAQQHARRARPGRPAPRLRRPNA